MQKTSFENPTEQNPLRGALNESYPLILLFCAFCFLFQRIIFKGEIFYFRDILYYAYPMKHFIWESFQQGDMPFWQTSIMGGVPFFALMHPAALYPFSALFFLEDFNSAFNLFFLLQHWALAAGTYILCRFWGISSQGSLGSALTALLGGYFLSISSFHNHFQSGIWLPFIFFSFLNYIQTGKKRYFLAAILCQTFQVLGGSPESCLFTVALLLPYSLFCVPDNGRVDGVAKRSCSLGLVIACSLGLSAIQLLPTYFLMEHSLRGQGMSFEASVRWAMDWSELKSFLLPVNFRNFMMRPHLDWNYFLQSSYMGLLPILFFIFALSLHGNRIVYFWSTVFIAGIFFALGSNNPLYIYFFNYVPGFDSFRYPEKFLFLSAFALVFLTGYGIDHLPQVLQKRKILFKWLLPALGLAIISISLKSPGRGIITPILILTILSICAKRLYDKKSDPIRFQWILVILIFLDLGYRNFPLIPTISRSYYEAAPQLLDHTASKDWPYRVYSGDLSAKTLHTKKRFPSERTHHLISLTLKEQLYPNLSGIYGVESVDGKTGIRLKGPEKWVDNFIHAPADMRTRILERSNVRKWVTNQNQVEVEFPKERNSKAVKELSLGFPINGSYDPMLKYIKLKTVETFSNPLPRSYIVPQTQIAKPEEVLETYYDPEFDPRKTALVEETVSLDGCSGYGKIHTLVYRPNKLTIQAHADGDCFLVLMDNDFPGWSAYVNGEEAKIFRANFFYRGLLLESGENKIEFEFVPVGYYSGAAISILTVFLMIWRLFFPNLKWKRFPFLSRK